MATTNPQLPILFFAHGKPDAPRAALDGMLKCLLVLKHPLGSPPLVHINDLVGIGKGETEGQHGHAVGFSEADLPSALSLELHEHSPGRWLSTVRRFDERTHERSHPGIVGRVRNGSRALVVESFSSTSSCVLEAA